MLARKHSRLKWHEALHGGRKTHIIIAYTVILWQDDLHSVPFFLYCPAQGCYNITHAPNLSNRMMYVSSGHLTDHPTLLDQAYMQTTINDTDNAN